MDNRKLREKARIRRAIEQAREDEERLSGSGLGWAEAYRVEVSELLDALEASEKERERLERENERLREIAVSDAYLERLERQNARLGVQLETANRALEKAVRGESG